MKSREYLLYLASKGYRLALSESEIQNANDGAIENCWEELRSTDELDTREHPRIALLLRDIRNIDADAYSKEILHELLEKHKASVIDGSVMIDNWDDINSLMHLAPGLGLEIWLYQIGLKQIKEQAEAHEKEYLRARNMLHEIPQPNWLGKIANRTNTNGLKRQEIFGVDFSLCVEYLRLKGLIPVCDLSVLMLLRSSFQGEHPEYLEVFDQTVFTGHRVLEQLCEEDSRIVWISGATSITGSAIYSEKCRISKALTDGRLYGVVCGSAFNGGYAGLTLYRWNSALWSKEKIGERIAKFCCGHTELNGSASQ